jgi:serine/threonine protein phosphatase PrpC
VGDGRPDATARQQQPKKRIRGVCSRLDGQGPSRLLGVRLVSHSGAGDRLTFISDGVVEATSPGGELYGFARTQAISNQPAHAIAAAARRFGQEDDITVVSVVRNAQ